MLKNWLKRGAPAFFGVLLALATVIGYAQVSSTQVSLTATTVAQPAVLCSAQPAVNTATTCTTATPPGSQSVYVTAVYFDVCTDGTGSASTNVNYTLTGASVGATGTGTATSIATYSIAASAEICQHWGYAANGNAVLFKGNPGQPIVITPPTAATHNSTASTVFGYIAS